LAIRQGLTVIGAVGERDETLTRELGATPVRYGSDLLSNVREVTDRVDATFDAAGKGGLQDAIALTGGSDRVITLADERAAELGVRFSTATPDRAPDAVEIGMQLLASGELRLRSQQSLPISAAGEAHRLLEQGHVHHKLLLTTRTELSAES
jgi:Zinc-binding dehydrogenase